MSHATCIAIITISFLFFGAKLHIIIAKGRRRPEDALRGACFEDMYVPLSYVPCGEFAKTRPADLWMM